MTKKAASDIAPEILRKHLGPARMSDAIDRLAKHIENGALLSCTDPVAFLDAVTERLAHTETQLRTFVAWVEEPCLSRNSKVYCRAMGDVLAKLRELGLVKNA